jgi:hypothetical protein
MLGRSRPSIVPAAQSSLSRRDGEDREDREDERLPLGWWIMIDSRVRMQLSKSGCRSNPLAQVQAKMQLRAHLS